MFYSDWGFRRNPFDTDSLPPSPEGEALLVGREQAVRAFRKRLENYPRITTVEGLNGIGKTSIINVGMYRAFRDAINDKARPLLIPCRRPFQIDASTSPADFRLHVLMEVAQTLIERKIDLPIRPGHTKHTINPALDNWLNNPQVVSYTGGVWVVSGGLAKETNTGAGFERSGFEKAVLSWLESIFPTRDHGGVVCVIDNLELLQTSQKARETLESLRDTVLNLTGVRWVLCGALGIVNGVASSPRLDGKLHRPIVVHELNQSFAVEIFQARIEEFKHESHARLPISKEQFLQVFGLMRGNLRSTLSECDEFCAWVADGVDRPRDFEPTLFETWLAHELESAYTAVRAEIRPRAMGVFETACKFEVFSPGDFVEFGYDKPEAMRPQIKALESVGVLVSTIDDTDKRRKTIQVTPKGWKVQAYINSVNRLKS